MAGARKTKVDPASIRPHREWCKAPASIRRDAEYYTLPLEYQGAYWNLLLYSLSESDIPGLFLDSRGEPLEANDIAFAAARNEAECAALKNAIPALRRAHLITWTRDEGFEITRYMDAHCAEAEIVRLERKREGNRNRKRKERAAGPDNVTPLHRQAEES